MKYFCINEIYNRKGKKIRFLPLFSNFKVNGYFLEFTKKGIKIITLETIAKKYGLNKIKFVQTGEIYKIKWHK